MELGSCLFLLNIRYNLIYNRGGVKKSKKSGAEPVGYLRPSIEPITTNRLLAEELGEVGTIEKLRH